MSLIISFAYGTDASDLRAGSLLPIKGAQSACRTSSFPAAETCPQLVAWSPAYLTQWRDSRKFISPEFSDAVVCLICKQRTSAGVKFRGPVRSARPGPRFDVRAPLVLDITSDDALCWALEILEFRHN